MTTFGGGQYTYQVVERFFKRPRKWSFMEAADVDVDADDNVYVFNRGHDAAVQVYDKEGNFLDGWGRNGRDFITPHGLTVGPQGNVYTADQSDHSVRVWTKEGKLLLTIGSPHQNAPMWSGKPFNKPTALSVASNGDYYASDGYGNANVHCFDPEGKLKFSWGTRGTGPGQFDTIHNLFVDREDGDKVYAADRWNCRVQFFTREGQFLGEWTGLDMPNSVRKGRDGNFYVAELGHRISVLSPEGEVLARWGDKGVEEVDTLEGAGYMAEAQCLPESPSRGPDQHGLIGSEPGAGLFVAPHGMTVDSQGSIYVAEVSDAVCRVDRGQRCIQKFVRVS